MSKAQTYKQTKKLSICIWLFLTSFYDSSHFNFYSGAKLQGDYFAWCFNEPLVAFYYVAICLPVDYNPVWLANGWHCSKVHITVSYLRAHCEITLNMNTASPFHQIPNSLLLTHVSKISISGHFITDLKKKKYIYIHTSSKFPAHKLELPFI